MIRMEIFDTYTDGGWIERKGSTWGFVVIKDKKIFHSERGIILGPPKITGRQVAGECEAVKRALTWAKNNNVKIRIFYDLKNLYCWVSDLFGDRHCWKANKPYTKDYRLHVLEHKDFLFEMVKVRSHANCEWNNWIDNHISFQ